MRLWQEGTHYRGWRVSSSVGKMLVASLLAAVAVGTVGCGKKNQRADRNIHGPTFETDADGNMVRRFDINGDDVPDVTKTFKDVPDENDPSVTHARMIKKEVDVNSSGNVGMRRSYNERGDLTLEELDTDLDGVIDTVNHIDGGNVVRKDKLDPTTGAIVVSRYYAGGTLQRVEQDTTGDGKVDYWEFYEEGVLDRIGRDVNGDGRADTWQRR